MSKWPDFKILRADKIARPGMIDGQIILQLRDADLVIADLATSNANAFYEIGIRHMVVKPIVHIQQQDEQIPFDLSIYRAVPYSMDSVEAIDKAVADLTAQVEQAIDPAHKIDNPVTRTLGREHASQTPLPEFELLQGEMASLRAAVESLQNEQRARALREEIVRSLTSSKSQPAGIIGALGTGRSDAPRGLLSDLGQMFQPGSGKPGVG